MSNPLEGSVYFNGHESESRPWIEINISESLLYVKSLLQHVFNISSIIGMGQ